MMKSIIISNNEQNCRPLIYVIIMFYYYHLLKCKRRWKDKHTPLCGGINNAYGPAGLQGRIDSSIKTLIYNSITEAKPQALRWRKRGWIQERGSSPFHKFYSISLRTAVVPLHQREFMKLTYCGTADLIGFLEVLFKVNLIIYKKEYSIYPVNKLFVHSLSISSRVRCLSLYLSDFMY